MVTPRNFNLGQLIVAFDGETAVIHGPARNSNGAETEIESSEEALRNWVRHDSAGRYRPLPGAANMRPDWRVRCSAALPLSTALDIVYPLAMLHIEQRRAGTLDVVPLQSVLERQTGRYARAVSLPSEARAVAANVLCGHCVKQPLWNSATVQGDQIPCPEPCSVMVSLCRDAAVWESAPPPTTPVDSTLAWAAFESPGNELREQYLGERFAASNRVGLSHG